MANADLSQQESSSSPETRSAWVAQPVDSSVAPPSGAYSAGLRFGELVFVAGQGPFEPNSGAILGSTVEEQTEACIKNLERVLFAADADLSTVLKTVVYLCDFAYFERYDRVYARYFSHPLPVRTTLAVGLGGILVEIDAIAAVKASTAAQT